MTVDEIAKMMVVSAVQAQSTRADIDAGARRFGVGVNSARSILAEVK